MPAIGAVGSLAAVALLRVIVALVIAVAVDVAIIVGGLAVLLLLVTVVGLAITLVAAAFTALLDGIASESAEDAADGRPLQTATALIADDTARSRTEKASARVGEP